VHNWGWMVDRGWLVHNRGLVVDWGWVSNKNWRCMVCNWPVDNRGWVVHWRRLVVGWSMDWSMSRSMDSSAVLLSSVWVMDILRGSMGLAGNNGSIRSMGLVD